MNVLLKLEYLALVCLSIFLFSLLPYPWWLYLVLFLTPDIGMIGYLINTRIGAFTYNLTHLIFIGIGLYLIGSFMSAPLLQLIGVVMLGHSNFDRILGFGLKHADSFKHTHLGNI
jgi:hypothetical protein